MEETMVERRRGQPIKPKQTIKQLEVALTKALRTHPECDGIHVQKITLLADPGGVANWDAELETEQQGVALTAKQRQVMLAAKLGVQKKLDLAENN
jgi:hypothetical protein